MKPLLLLSMYHDQGRIATKLKGFNRGVATTGALEQAVRLAARLAAARRVPAGAPL